MGDLAEKMRAWAAEDLQNRGFRLAMFRLLVQKTGLTRTELNETLTRGMELAKTLEGLEDDERRIGDLVTRFVEQGLLPGEEREPLPPNTPRLTEAEWEEVEQEPMAVHLLPAPAIVGELLHLREELTRTRKALEWAQWFVGLKEVQALCEQYGDWGDPEETLRIIAEALEDAGTAGTNSREDLEKAIRRVLGAEEDDDIVEVLKTLKAQAAQRDMLENQLEARAAESEEFNLRYLEIAREHSAYRKALEMLLEYPLHLVVRRATMRSAVAALYGKETALRHEAEIGESTRAEWIRRESLEEPVAKTVTYMRGRSFAANALCDALVAALDDGMPAKAARLRRARDLVTKATRHAFNAIAKGTADTAEKAVSATLYMMGLAPEQTAQTELQAALEEGVDSEQ